MPRLGIAMMWLGLTLTAAADVQWKSGVSGDWFTAENWVGGAVPAAGDNVTLPPGSGRAILSRATARLGTIKLDGTLVCSNWNSALRATAIVVSAEGVVTLPGPFTGAAGSNNIAVECEALTIEPGGRIIADGAGYAGGLGHARDDDPSSAGHGPGAGGFPKIWGASPGGSYGGRGGTSNAAPVYGRADNPEQPGSGGGGGNGRGGAGGGAIRITAGTLCNDGLITACGASASGGTYGGGGSGGGIALLCERILGHGEIRADGGDGSIYAGGGGGGRIALRYMRGTRSAVRFWTRGGANGRGFWGSQEALNFGEAGTLWFSPSKAPGHLHPLAGRVNAETNAGDAEAARRMTVAYYLPWEVNPPIITVEKALYRAQPRANAAALVRRMYAGPQGEMLEIQSVEARDDVPTEESIRFSSDHGRTWSDPRPEAPVANVFKGVEVLQYANCGMLYDPQSELLVSLWLRQIVHGGRWNNFTYVRVSRDGGRTWSEPRQLRYEPGPDFDPADPLKPEFLARNQAYIGNNIIRHSNGALITGVAHANAEGDSENESRPWKMAALCFIGKWDRSAGGYRWTPGARVEISPAQSARGLMEPEVAELKDGRVLVVWRGSDTPETPGRKWFSVSADGGRTLAPVREWRYDDGTPFYSPSSYQRMIRHSANRKLYWVGNISPVPPAANAPRHPLVIAEVDETAPALKRNTVTLIDTKQPMDGPELQLSNFALYENRETHALELFLTAYGRQPGMENWMNADCYRYILTLAE